LVEWVGREQPDGVSVQELKAERERIPGLFTVQSDDWSYWHRERARSGAAPLLRNSCCPDPPVFTHFEFDRERASCRDGRRRERVVYLPGERRRDKLV